MIQLKVLCDLCTSIEAALHPDARFTWAFDPAFEPEDGDECVLTCVPWERRRIEGTRLQCDHCRQAVAVAPSSYWLLQRGGRLIGFGLG